MTLAEPNAPGPRVEVARDADTDVVVADILDRLQSLD